MVVVVGCFVVGCFVVGAVVVVVVVVVVDGATDGIVVGGVHIIPPPPSSLSDDTESGRDAGIKLGSMIVIIGNLYNAS